MVIHTKITIGSEYKFLGMNENNIGSFQFRNAIRKYRILMYAGVEAAANMDGIQFVSGKKESLWDEEIDGISLDRTAYFNKNGESYVNLFKRHQEEKESK